MIFLSISVLKKSHMKVKSERMTHSDSSVLAECEIRKLSKKRENNPDDRPVVSMSFFSSFSHNKRRTPPPLQETLSMVPVHDHMCQSFTLTL